MPTRPFRPMKQRLRQAKRDRGSVRARRRRRGWRPSSSMDSSSTIRSSNAPAACCGGAVLMIDIQALEGCKVLDIATFPGRAVLRHATGRVRRGSDQGRAARGRRPDPPVRHDDRVRRHAALAVGMRATSGASRSNCASPKGAAMLKRLVAKSDVLIENFQPGTLEGWGLGWDVLQRGQSAADHGAHLRLRPDRAIQRSAWLRPHRQRLRRAVLPGRLSGPAAGDTGVGDDPRLHGRAVRRARRDAGVAGARQTGRGQWIDIGLYEPIFRILDEMAPAFATRATSASAWGRAPSTSSAQPLPDQGRTLDRHRLHQRQDLRPHGRGHGPT